MNLKFLKLASGIIFVAVCLHATEAGPAYPGSTFNSWDTQPVPQQQPQRRSPVGQKRTLQSAVRQHMDDLDKQTQNDLKVLGYFEKELNKIFSCYIKLSCPRMRSPKVMSECDEIKDWPLYHQVMKMTGIRKYPYQSYAPAPSPSRLLATTEIPYNLEEESTNPSDLAINNGDDLFSTDENDEAAFPPQRPLRQRQNRRIRRGSKNQHHHHQHHLTGAPVTNDDNQ